MKEKMDPKKIMAATFLILAIVVSVLLLKSKATDVTSNLTITNSVPNDLINIGEDVASTDTSPTNEGTSVTITGTATDDNGDSWILVVCKTAGISGTSCDGGAGDQWCVSGSGTSGNPNSCSITTTGITTENNPWFAYACDSSGCSNVSQGSYSGGDAGRNSPFYVNHAPSFTVSNDGPKNPGATLTFTASATDSDIDPTQDTMTLYICKENNWTPAGGCGGTGSWCTSSATAGNGSNPVNVSCNIDLDNPMPDGNYDYYAFLKDSHNFASSSADQGTLKTFTVNNVAPVVSGISIENWSSTSPAGLLGQLDLDPTKGGTTTSGFKVHFTVTDNNSCTLKSGTGDEINAASTFANVRESIIAQTSCDESGEADTDDCYPLNSCTQDIGSCTGISDPNATFTCNFPLSYNAKPTLGGPYDAEYWLASVKAIDNNSLDSGLVDGIGGNGSTNELYQFLAFAVKQTDGITDLATIDYGTMSLNAVTTDLNSPNSKVVAQGNTGLDQKLSGSDMLCNSGSTPSCAGETILVSAQKYGLANNFNYNTSTDILSNTATTYQYCAKPTSVAGGPIISTFWKIKVPAGKPLGNYRGTDTIIGAVSDGITHAW